MTTKPRRTNRARLALLLALLLLGAAGMSRYAAADGPNTLYLPQLGRPGTAPPPTPVPPTPTPPTTTPTTGSLVFTGSAARSADIAVDAQGGIHAIAVRDNPRLDGDIEAVIYAYCAPANLARCNTRAGWATVDLPADAVFAQLELDRQGHPRILYEEGASGTNYVYAACDNACTRLDSWQRIVVTGRTAIGSPFLFDYKPQYFTLDQLGRPRFIYEDYHPTGTQEHEGVFYAYCDAACTTPGSWRETRIMLKPDFGEQITIAFDSRGRLRGLTTMIWQNDGAAQNGRLTYLSCEQGCESADNWRLTPLPLDRGYEHSQYTLKLDSRDRVRVLFFQGYHENPRANAHLWYLRCDANCANSDSWAGATIDAFEGAYAYDGDLAFDANDNPRIAVYKSAALFYAWCTGACQTDDAIWAARELQLAPIMEAQMPISTWPGCLRNTWVAGERPALALDAQGNPRLAFDADHYMECYRNPDRPQDGTYTESRWQSAGVYFFPRP